MTRVVVSPDATCALLDDGAVVLHMRTKRYFSLNKTGAAIWQLLESGVSVADIVTSLTERYEVDYATASSSVDTLIAELESASLVATAE